MINQQLIRKALITITALTLSACSNYRVTINNQDIQQSTPLFSAFTIEDEKLRQCVNEHIKDQQAISAESLRFLNCSHRQIKSIGGLEDLTGLRHIDLSNNAITSIANLLKFQDLEAVDLRGNAELNCEENKQLLNLKPGLKIKSPKKCL